jgi:hypothetical protein
MAELHTKVGVELAIIDEVTLDMLFGILAAAKSCGLSVVTITSGSDGVHSGPNDPHHFGHALDVRVHDFPASVPPATFLASLLSVIGPKYFAFIEDAGTSNEHLHVQWRNWEPLPAGAATTPAPVTT